MNLKPLKHHRSHSKRAGRQYPEIRRRIEGFPESQLIKYGASVAFDDIRHRVKLYDKPSDRFKDSLGLTNTTERVKREKAGFLSTVKDIFTKGLLEAVAGKDISDLRIFPD